MPPLKVDGKHGNVFFNILVHNSIHPTIFCASVIFKNISVYAVYCMYVGLFVSTYKYMYVCGVFLYCVLRSVCMCVYYVVYACNNNNNKNMKKKKPKRI